MFDDKPSSNGHPIKNKLVILEKDIFPTPENERECAIFNSGRTKMLETIAILDAFRVSPVLLIRLAYRWLPHLLNSNNSTNDPIPFPQRICPLGTNNSDTL